MPFKKVVIYTSIAIFGILTIAFFVVKQQAKKHDVLLNQLIQEINSRKKYDSLTFEVLKEIPDQDLENAIVDFVTDHKVGKNYDREYEIVIGLPKGLQYIYATWWLEAEVNNGGFNQYFYNTSSQFVLQAQKGYRAFNAVEHADIVEKAIKIYNKEKTMHQAVKQKGTIEAFANSYDNTELNKIDTQFYALMEDIHSLRVKYIRQNIKEFICK